MEVERKIIANTLLLTAGQIVAQVANFGFVILFARSFGVQTLGV
jgi:O-antigen/teichoic acid export membrane protein